MILVENRKDNANEIGIHLLVSELCAQVDMAGPHGDVRMRVVPADHSQWLVQLLWQPLEKVKRNAAGTCFFKPKNQRQNFINFLFQSWNHQTELDNTVNENPIRIR